MKLPKKYKQPISTIIMSFGMGLFMSLIFTMIFIGLNEGFFLRWLKSYTLAILIALPSAFFFRYIAQKFTDTLSGKYKHIVFGMIISLGMGLFISLIITMIFTGINDGLLLRWVKSFVLAISIAIPTALVFGPIAQKLTNKIVED